MISTSIMLLILSIEQQDNYTWFWLPLKQGQALFSGARDRPRGNRQKQKRLYQSIWKHFFTLSVTKHRNRLPREDWVSPSLQVFKTHLDMVLSSWLWVVLPGRGMDKTTSIVPFHSQLLYDHSSCPSSLLHDFFPDRVDDERERKRWHRMIGQTFRNGIGRHDGTPETLGNKSLSPKKPWKYSAAEYQGLTQEDQSRKVLEPSLLWVWAPMICTWR